MDYPIRFTEQLRPQIRALRKKRGLTQAVLGRQLGVGQARIAEIERSPGTVSVDQMLKLLSLLGAGLMLRDSLSAPAVGEPSHRAAKKPPESATKKRRSVLVSRKSQDAIPATDLKALRKLNPNASVVPTSARHHVIRPKKGSW